MTELWQILKGYFRIDRWTLYLILFYLTLLIPFGKALKFNFKPRHILWAILCLGLLLRIGWLHFSSHVPKTSWEQPNRIENDLINIQAVELTQGKWFLNPDRTPSGRRPIGYPIALALCYKVFGVSNRVAQCFHLLLHLLTIYFIYRLGKYFLESVGLLAAFLWSIYPISIYGVALITDEHLFLPVWFGGLVLLLETLQGRQKNSVGRWILIGALWGYTVMIRTHPIFMPAVLAILLWFHRESLKKIIFLPIFIFCLMQLVNLPWAIRNYRAWGVPVMYTATSSFIYAQVNSSASAKGEGHIPVLGEADYSPELARAFESKNEGLVHRLANREMKKWMFTHPVRMLVMGTGRLLYFMRFDREGGVWPLWYQFYEGCYDPSRPVSQKTLDFLSECQFIFYYFLFWSWLLGMFFVRKSWQVMNSDIRLGWLMLFGCFLFYFVEQMIIYPDRKYRHPLEPIMIIFASYAITSLRGLWLSAQGWLGRRS